MTMLSEMLEETVVGILSRLPPKSLIRFRCVSKLWDTIINDPSFVAKQLSISRHNKFASETCILVKHTLLKDRSTTDKEKIAALKKRRSFDNNDIDLLLSLLQICNDNDGDDGNLTFVVEELGVLFPSSIYPSTLEIKGHCDGIVCLSNNVDIDILCNIAIREFNILPKSCVLYDLPPRAEDEDEYDAPRSNTTAIGFGLDSKAKEYKVVRVVETVSGVFTQHPTRAEVYTMGANNSWRELEDVDLGCHVYWSPSFVMHFEGIFYWWAFTPIDKELIVTFDMSDELFHRIPMPDGLDFNKDGRYRSLAVLKDSIALLTYEYEGDHKSFDIWMMDESTGVKGSWIKYMAFGPVEGIQIPLVFWNSDEELLMVSDDSHVVSYNMGTKKLHRFPIQGVEGAACLQAVNYVNSVISVRHRKHESVASGTSIVGREGSVDPSDNANGECLAHTHPECG